MILDQWSSSMRESFVFGKKNDDKMTHAVKGLDKNIINDLNKDIIQV